MSDLTLDFAGATLRPLNGVAPTLGLDDEDLALAAMEPEDPRYRVGQWLQCIGPLAGAKIRKEGPAVVKVLARAGAGYRVTKYPGCCAQQGADTFIHDHAAHKMWLPIDAPDGGSHAAA